MTASDIEVPQLGELGGFPLYLGDHPKAIEILFEQGEDFFYIIGSEAFEIQGANNTVKKATKASLFVVRKNLVGYSIVPVNDNVLGISQEVKSSAVFTLPQIPWELQVKMSSFFHKAFEVHGTEAVLILTYDENFLDTEDPGQGWGCLSPKQSNTPHACHYNIDEDVMAAKPEHVTIVGSMHSHPEMTAYFSGTDHNDQADWDGIHITIGWPKGKTYKDDYHIEMIQGGESWSYKAEDIFAAPPLPKTPDTAETVDGWMTNVSRKTHTVTGGTHHGIYGGGTGGHKSPTPNPRPPRKHRMITLPKDAPDPQTNILITAVPDEKAAGNGTAAKCLACGLNLISFAIEQGRCYGCGSFVALESETIEQYHARYEATNGGSSHSDAINPAKATKPIIFLYENGDSIKWGSDVRHASTKK